MSNKNRNNTLEYNVIHIELPYVYLNYKLTRYSGHKYCYLKHKQAHEAVVRGSSEHTLTIL